MERDPAMAAIEPLFLPSRSGGKKDEQTCEVVCIFCDIAFLADKGFQNLLTHLLKEHHFVISNFATGVADPPGYFAYWKERFREVPDITDLCVVLKTNIGENNVGTRESYLLLSDKLPEDIAIRGKLRKSKLYDVLAYQEHERSDTSFRRACLFCKQIFTENRTRLLDHMAHAHNFSVGRPDNLVYVEELLDVLEAKLSSMLCLYCEKTFKDWQTLKEHMRKKRHKKINPRNRAYDKYYVINYTEDQADGVTFASIETTMNSRDAVLFIYSAILPISFVVTGGGTHKTLRAGIHEREQKCIDE